MTLRQSDPQPVRSSRRNAPAGTVGGAALAQVVERGVAILRGERDGGGARSGREDASAAGRGDELEPQTAQVHDDAAAGERVGNAPPAEGPHHKKQIPPG